MMKTMRKWRKAAATALILIPLLVYGEQQARVVQTPESLKEQIKQIQFDRDAALKELSARYQQTPLEQRAALEKEGVELDKSFEIKYLELTVEYYTLLGNSQKALTAQVKLNSLHSVEQKSVDLTKQSLVQKQTQAEQSVIKEGVSSDAK